MIPAILLLMLAGCSNDAKKVCEHVGKKANANQTAIDDCVGRLEQAKDSCNDWNTGMECAMTADSFKFLHNCFEVACEYIHKPVPTPP